MQTSHTPRVEWQAYKALAPDVNAAVSRLSGAAEASGIDKRLLELVKLRVSQINGCAFCVAYHITEAQRHGVEADKLHLVVAWRETPLFDERERAALAWAEALTLIADGVADAIYAQARAEFAERELAQLTGAVLAINAWNRLAIAYRFTPLPIAPGHLKVASA